MTVDIIQTNGKRSTICVETIVSINEGTSKDGNKHYSCTCSSGDIYHLDEFNVDIVREAVNFRDKQLQTLIENTDSIISELEKLNSTATDIEGHASVIDTQSRAINTNTQNIKSNTDSIKTQTNTNGTLLSQIKSVCDNIYSWVRNHYS